MQNQRLTAEEVIALDKILVENNEQIVALHFACGYYGRGGSNSSPYTPEIDAVRRLEDIAGQAPLKIFGVQICAVVNDVVYLMWENRANGEVFTFDAKGRYSNSYGIAYDTMRGCSIEPILK